MMKKILLFSLMFFGLMWNAQISGSSKIGDGDSKWTFGGYAGLGGSFGSGGGGTTVYITPRVGYRITDDFEAGVAGSFSWSNSSYYSSTMIGVGPFVNYYFSRSFFLGGMFQEYFINQTNKSTDQKYSGNEAALYLGGGYMQQLGNRTYIQIGGMYNVLYQKEKSVFGGGFVPQVGIVYGL